MATTNGAKHANGITATPEIPVTKALAQFVATAKREQLTPELREKVKEVLIDYIGVAVGGVVNADSTEPIYNAVKAFQGPGIGNSTAIAKGGSPHCCTGTAVPALSDSQVPGHRQCEMSPREVPRRAVCFLSVFVPHGSIFGHSSSSNLCLVFLGK